MPASFLIPPEITQKARRLKTVLITIIAIILVSIAALYYALIAHPKIQIEALHAKYAAIIKPATHAQVLQTMGTNPTWNEPSSGSAFWDDDALSNQESKKITHILSYTVDTFYLRVTFEFTFDKDQNLIGKHRYD